MRSAGFRTDTHDMSCRRRPTRFALVHAGRRVIVFNLALLEDFRCPLCEDFGIVEVSVEPAFGLASETNEAETEWRVCECRKGEGSSEMSGRP